MKKISFNTSFLKIDVTAIKIVKNLILIGVGSHLIIYDRNKKKIIERVYIFDQTISGIEYSSGKIIIYGENVIVLYELIDLNISKLNEFIYNDWILSAKFINSYEIVFVSMHSEVVYLNRNFVTVEIVKSTEICTCYCAHIVNDNWEDLYVLSGTAFSQIFIWKPSVSINGKSPIIYKLIGHKGAIFSLDYSKHLERICSTSDDGKAMLWPAKNIFGKTPLEIREIVPIREIQHRQRVFKCRFFKDILITALEDSSIKIWNCTLNSPPLKTSAHQIGSVWCLDFCEVENLVFTGGADGGIVSTPLEKINFCQVDNIFGKTNNEILRYKDLVLLNSEVAIGITDAGCLIVTNTENEHQLIHQHNDLHSYGIMKKSPCGTLLCLGGMHGNIHLYSFKNEEVVYELSCRIKNNPKIFSLHWLSCRTFLTCITEGVLILWYVSNGDLTPTQFFQLPQSKERWSTSATICGVNNILVGDRKGSLYLYNLESNYPVQILKRVQPMGVTKLYYIQRNHQVIVLGRNGILHKYYFDEQQEELSLITKDKLPFSWLGAYHIYENKEIILGFSNDKFLVWNHTSRRNILEISCGGGHRLWDFHVDRNNFTLIYQKISKLTSIRYNLENEVKNIIEGFHGTETNSMKLIKINNDPLRCISISGGEDTTLRLCHFDFSDKLNGFSTISTIKSHLSSVRTITYHKINDNYFIFSAGGRAQIILWELRIFENPKDIFLREIRSYYKNLEGYESEIRIMDLKTIQIINKIILFTACSNGYIKIYIIDQNKPEIIPIRTIFHKERCILKIFTLNFDNLNVLVTASTDGYITFLNIANFLLNMELNTDIPVINSVKTNQSGINSYSYFQINQNQVVILTGGDDKAFTLTLIECKLSENVEITKLCSYTNENFHFAHISGVYITENYFLTASIDQKVIVFKWWLNNNVFNIECVYKRFTSVTDLQGIDYFANSDKDLELVLFGNGFEIFTVSIE